MDPVIAPLLLAGVGLPTIVGGMAGLIALANRHDGDRSVAKAMQEQFDAQPEVAQRWLKGQISDHDAYQALHHPNQPAAPAKPLVTAIHRNAA